MGENIFFNKKREHSRKPDFVKDMIVKCSGDFTRLELFAREESKNWDSWGNDTQKFNKNTIQHKLF